MKKNELICKLYVLDTQTFFILKMSPRHLRIKLNTIFGLMTKFQYIPKVTGTYIHRQEVRDQISKMLELGIIRPSESAWSSPIWVVPKKADASGKQELRLVEDFRKLNDKTIDDKYPIPNITDELDKHGRCQYFTTLDLASDFYQVEMNPDDIPKTAFNVKHGHFEFLRMLMGLKTHHLHFSE